MMDEDKTELIDPENKEVSCSVYLEDENTYDKEKRDLLAAEYTECVVISVILAAVSLMPLIFPEFVCTITEMFEKIYETGAAEIIKNGLSELAGCIKI